MERLSDFWSAFILRSRSWKAVSFSVCSQKALISGFKLGKMNKLINKNVWFHIFLMTFSSDEPDTDNKIW